MTAVTVADRPLRRLLCQTKWVADRLGMAKLGRWLDFELNGFPEESDLPPYRKVSTQQLEAYNQAHDIWVFAGHLNYSLQVRQPLEEIEQLAKVALVEIPVLKNFSLKTGFNDSFGSDWPQRFIVPGTEYKRLLDGIITRWNAELESCGLQVTSPEKLSHALDQLCAH